ncbi:nucleotide exchange factor GrpE [Candidatus Saccharibacteria bacterium]|nr:nucleotide exchange factor GrpE [Candidatus Saccharibacteria bacterium]
MLKKSENPEQPKTDPNLTKIAELTNDLQRTRADFENYRKQMDAQKAQAIEFTKYETVKKVLPLLDDIDRAISATPELKPLAKNLEKTLSELKLEKINTAPNTEFNPDLHDAVMMEDSEGEKEVIAETLRAGYLYNGNVIRPAMVKVKNI